MRVDHGSFVPCYMHAEAYVMSDRPYIDFSEVKEKCPIPEVLDKLGILGQFTRKGDTLNGPCPIPLHHHGPQPNKEQFKIDRKR